MPKPAAMTQKLTHMRLPPGWLKSASASVPGSFSGKPSTR
jgi:hypothetical protein